MLLIQAFGPAAVDGAPSRNDELFFSITSTVDSYISLPNKSAEYVEELPSAVVVDFKLVRVIDLTALIRLKEIVESARGLCACLLHILLGLVI